MIVAGRVAQGDVEVVHVIQRAVTGGPEAGVTVTVIALLGEPAPPPTAAAAPAASRVQPPRLQGECVIPAADSLQVAGRRMAGVARAGGLEVCLAALRSPVSTSWKA